MLFDEIEKAHPDVFNTLLQILEEGRLTDSQGRSVDFRNTVLIMTSNLGTADLRKANVGFTTADEAVTYERMKEKVNDALKQHFRPEFLNRIDEIIVFHELIAGRGHADRRPDDSSASPASSRARASASSSPRPPRSCWPTKGYDPQLGARPLRRAIQRLVEDPLSERLLYKEFRAGEIIVVDAEDDPDKPGRAADHVLAPYRARPRPRGSATDQVLGGRGLRPAGIGGTGDDLDGAGDHPRARRTRPASDGAAQAD